MILVWYLALIFPKRQDEIRDYDYQALTHNEWIPKEFKRLALADLDSDWNRCDYAGLGKCDDLGLNGLDHDYG